MNQNVVIGFTMLAVSSIFAFTLMMGGNSKLDKACGTTDWSRAIWHISLKLGNGYGYSQKWFVDASDPNNPYVKVVSTNYVHDDVQLFTGGKYMHFAHASYNKLLQENLDLCTESPEKCTCADGEDCTPEVRLYEWEWLFVSFAPCR